MQTRIAYRPGLDGDKSVGGVFSLGECFGYLSRATFHDFRLWV